MMADRKRKAGEDLRSLVFSMIEKLEPNIKDFSALKNIKLTIEEENSNQISEKVDIKIELKQRNAFDKLFEGAQVTHEVNKVLASAKKDKL